MKRHAVIFASILLVVCAEPKCYEEIGCFSRESPFDNGFSSTFVSSREDVGTSFLLNTRNNSDHSAYDNLTTSDVSSISSSYLNPHLPTKVIVHGFTENGHVEWMREMATALLQQGNYNVIRVDWSKGAALPKIVHAHSQYQTACTNTRIAGAEISLLMDKLRKVYPNSTVADPTTWHIIGHSLGAHVAGYAGERQNGRLGRITGLDPAGPYFKKTKERVRLDPTDAIFVDVIHTDSTLCGIMKPVGHMDFYVNGGRYQPGCPPAAIPQRKSAIADNDAESAFFRAGVWLSCSHVRSYEYFTESILSSCPFMAGRATDENYRISYQRSRYFDNAHGATMGFYADQYRPSNGDTHLVYMSSTLLNAPYCAYQYRVRISFDNANNSTYAVDGSIHLNVVGTLGQSQNTCVGSVLCISGDVGDFRLNVGLDLGNITQIDFYWVPTESDDQGIYVTEMEILSMESHAEYLFTGPADKIESSNKRTFLPARRSTSRRLAPSGIPVQTC